MIWGVPWYSHVVLIVFIGILVLAFWKGVILPGLVLYWFPKNALRKLWVLEAHYGKAEVARALRCFAVAYK
jgi:hypothetical protein